MVEKRETLVMQQTTDVHSDATSLLAILQILVHVSVTGCQAADGYWLIGKNVLNILLADTSG